VAADGFFRSQTHLLLPADALAVARAKQENKEGWAKRRRKLYGQEH